MSIITSENRAHAATAIISESTRQADVAQAKAGFVAGGTQADFDAATSVKNRAPAPTAIIAESTRQADVAKAKAVFVAGGRQAVFDAATRASERSHYQRLQASAIANGLQSAWAQEALWLLGAGPL